MLVYVLSNQGTPLMPCQPGLARRLLKQGKAKVKRKEPFTIQLNYETTPCTKECRLGIDSGSSKIGAAVICEGKILYMSETEVRNDVHQTMEERKRFRRNRRNRKTRYRKKRFKNRKNSIRKDRYAPTILSKVHAHEKVIKEATSLLPIGQIVIEAGTFDTHLMQNPELSDRFKKIYGYQKGLLYGYENVRHYVLARDNYTCQKCKGKSKDSRLEVHHIVFRSQGGPDIVINLITLCKTCHQALHNGEFTIKPNAEHLRSLAPATQMNVIRSVLFKRYPDSIETHGYVTKANRINLGLPKEHYVDACVIASGGEPFEFATDVLIKHKCVAKGDRKLCKGKRGEVKLPTGKIHGFRKFDKVLYMGKTAFVRGRMSTGYAHLVDIDDHDIVIPNLPKGYKTPKLSRCKRISARKSWITDTIRIQKAV